MGSHHRGHQQDQDSEAWTSVSAEYCVVFLFLFFELGLKLWALCLHSTTELNSWPSCGFFWFVCLEFFVCFLRQGLCSLDWP